MVTDPVTLPLFFFFLFLFFFFFTIGAVRSIFLLERESTLAACLCLSLTRVAGWRYPGRAFVRCDLHELHFSCLSDLKVWGEASESYRASFFSFPLTLIPWRVTAPENSFLARPLRSPRLPLSATQPSAMKKFAILLRRFIEALMQLAPITIWTARFEGMWEIRAQSC